MTGQRRTESGLCCQTWRQVMSETPGHQGPATTGPPGF